MFPTSAIDPFPKSGFPGGDPYDQYNDLFASLFTFPAPTPAPLTEPIIQPVADGNTGEGLYALPGEAATGVTKPLSDGMADILGLFPAGKDLKKKPVQIGSEELPLSDVEPKKEDARFLGPPIPAIPGNAAETAPLDDGHNQDPEDVCSMPVDGKVPPPKVDAKNSVQPIDVKVDRRKHDDDHSIEFEVLELPTDPATSVHKTEAEHTRAKFSLRRSLAIPPQTAT
ncbi:MAG: hypothetical protein QM785_01805 [Pyrinomonadaceae bacterium]